MTPHPIGGRAGRTRRTVVHVSETVPLFPLSTVLLPGASLPLHIFEPRYRQLVVDVATGKVPGHEFGVLAIREGWATETTEITDPGQLYRVGCTARLRDVRKLPDGRFDIITKGHQRFRLLGLDTTSAPYLVGEVEVLPDAAISGPTEQRALPYLAQAARAAHRRYCEAAWRREDWTEFDEDLEPSTLADTLAADSLLALQDKQRILEEPSVAKRLDLLRRMLNTEGGLVSNLRAVPVPITQLGPTASRN